MAAAYVQRILRTFCIGTAMPSLSVKAPIGNTRRHFEGDCPPPNTADAGSQYPLEPATVPYAPTLLPLAPCSTGMPSSIWPTQVNVITAPAPVAVTTVETALILVTIAAATEASEFPLTTSCL